MQNAIDRILVDHSLLENLGRVGLVVNQASTTSNYDPTAAALEKIFQHLKHSSLVCVFGPQHGYWQTEQDNMRETEDLEFTMLSEKKIPLFSLYSEVRTPKKNQLENVDTILIDLQDIGCRVYTYMLTLAGCLRAASEFGKRVVVLDRLNPLGLCHKDISQQRWMGVEGNCLETRFHSFVGWYDLPLRHGLTMGELGYYFIEKDSLNVDYHVIKVGGLKRGSEDSKFAQIMSWTMPSPNIPTWQSAFFFPAFVTLEGTNISEGRGTTQPFQIIGAPWLDVSQCISFLEHHADVYSCNQKQNTSLKMRPHFFRPTFNKQSGNVCQGIQFHVLEDGKNINLYKLGILFLYFCSVYHAEDFQWSKPGYEYNFVDEPIHLILGEQDVCEFLNQNRTLALNNGSLGKSNVELLNEKSTIDALVKLLSLKDQQAQEFAQRAEKHFIY